MTHTLLPLPQAMASLIRDIGQLLLRWFRGIGGGSEVVEKWRKFVVRPYLETAARQVWGSLRDDPIFQLFYE